MKPDELTEARLKTPYQLECEITCEWCAKRLPRTEPTRGTPQAQRHFEYALSPDDDFPCTAPTRDEFEARLTAKIERLTQSEAALRRDNSVSAQDVRVLQEKIRELGEYADRLKVERAFFANRLEDQLSWLKSKHEYGPKKHIDPELPHSGQHGAR